MAGQKQTAAAPKQDIPREPPKPQGSRRIDEPKIDGWHSPKAFGENQVIAGQLVGLFEMKGLEDKMQKVVMIKLNHEAQAVLKGGETLTLKEGQVMGMRLSYKLLPLLDYVAHQGRVWVKTGREEDLSGGRSMRHFEINAVGKQAPPPEARKTQESGDDIPF